MNKKLNLKIEEVSILDNTDMQNVKGGNITFVFTNLVVKAAVATYEIGEDIYEWLDE